MAAARIPNRSALVQPGESASGPTSAARAWWIVVACAAFVVARKPWAILHPQFFAEDGSVFMTGEQEHGLHAFIEPYQGYLHFLPRLTAWLAAHTLDPQWWPACYNVAAFLLAALVFARLASARVTLPAKPWLALAIALAPGTGEVLGTITNVQWLTALLLVLQLFTTPAKTPALRVTDGVILAAAALTGPFSVLFLPFFAWRAWTARTADTWAWLAVVGVAAAVQGAFVFWTGPHYAYQDKPWNLAGLGGIVATRLVAWPLLGPSLLKHIAPAGLVAIGFGFLAFLVWQLRRGEGRATRVQVAALLVILLAAGVYRIRADTWEPHDIEHGDRYFFLPRVLFVWLLVLEVARHGRSWRVFGLTLAALGLVMNAGTFVLPAPRDYDWAGHCEPVRRGEPAQLPTLPEGWTVDYHGRPRTR